MAGQTPSLNDATGLTGGQHGPQGVAYPLIGLQGSSIVTRNPLSDAAASQPAQHRGCMSMLAADAPSTLTAKGTLPCTTCS
jgi:hypothetical protein